MSTRKRAAARNHSKQGPNRNVLFGAIAVVVVIAAIVAIVATSGDDSAESPPGQVMQETGTVTVTGDSLPEYDGTVSPDPAKGMTIPTIEGHNFAGEPVTITDDGRPKVILYAAHWCPHCQAEIPRIAADLQSNPLPSNVEMYVVSAAGQPSYPNYPASAWLAGVNWPTPVVVDDADSSAGTALGVTAYPYFAFVDSDNNVVTRVSGEIPVEDFRARVEAIAGV